MYLVESFPEREPLLEWCASYGLEGIVSKRLGSPYSSGACRNWVKVKTNGWRQANRFQHRMFEGNKKPALTEEQKTLTQTREELARVQERLRDPDLRAGIAKELRKHVELLEVEIADLEAAN